jgi:hypothetical protein
MIRFKQFMEESKDFSKYIMKTTKTEPKIVRKTNPAGRTTDHVEYEVHGTLSSHKRTFKSKKEAEAYFNTVKESIEETFKVGDFVKDPDGKTHRVFGVNGTNLETGIHYGKNKYGGTNNLHVSKAKKIPKPKDVNEEIVDEGAGGSESWEAGYKRRVVKTTSAEHKEKGHNWRIKGKERPEISIKLYKEKPSQAEFNKQMRRVAGHEFGG